MDSRFAQSKKWPRQVGRQEVGGGLSDSRRCSRDLKGCWFQVSQVSQVSPPQGSTPKEVAPRPAGGPAGPWGTSLLVQRRK